MKRWLALACVVPLAAARPAQDSPDAAKPPVRVAVQVVADRTRVEAGATFSLGVRFVVPPSSHLYWTNPGAGGTATTVALAAPEGFDVSAPAFPGPERFDEADGVVHYGYTGEFVVLYRVTAPKELPSTTKVRFTADARWTAHGAAVVLGSAKKELALSVADARHPAEAAETKLFERAQARAPRPWKELTGVQVEWSASKESATHFVAFRVDRAERLEFFPAPESGYDFAGRILGLERAFAVVTLKLVDRADVADAERRLRGLLCVERGGARKWYVVELAR